jgi:sigma-B regulation protein RsbU (phosphoserine phosphatase)
MLIIIFFLIQSMRSILVQEDQLNADLMQSKQELEQKSKETMDSIIYAKRIQEAILPLRERILESPPESFVFHLPRDIVSGDFYWFKRIENKIFIASVDCTGH